MFEDGSLAAVIVEQHSGKHTIATALGDEQAVLAEAAHTIRTLYGHVEPCFWTNSSARATALSLAANDSVGNSSSKAHNASTGRIVFMPARNLGQRNSANKVMK